MRQESKRKSRVIWKKPQHFQTVVHTPCNELLSFTVLCIALLYISASQDNAGCTNTVKRIEEKKKMLRPVLSLGRREHDGHLSIWICRAKCFFFSVEAPPPPALPCRWRRRKKNVPSLEPTRALSHQKKWQSDPPFRLGKLCKVATVRSARGLKKKTKKKSLVRCF